MYARQSASPEGRPPVDDQCSSLEKTFPHPHRPGPPLTPRHPLLPLSLKPLTTEAKTVAFTATRHQLFPSLLSPCPVLVVVVVHVRVVVLVHAQDYEDEYAVVLSPVSTTTAPTSARLSVVERFGRLVGPCR